MPARGSFLFSAARIVPLFRRAEEFSF